MAAKVREKDAQHWVFVNHQGQRRAKQVGPGKAGRKLADALAKQWNAALVLGQVEKVFPPKSKVVAQGALPSLRVALPAWIAQREKGGDIRGATGPAYLSAVKTWVFPDLGDVPADQVTREQIGAIIGKIKAAKKSRSTVGHVLKALRTYFRDLVETKRLAVNPAADLSYFVGKMPRARKIEIFTKAEMQTLLKAAEGSRLFPFVATALGTGARWGELAALTKDDMDLRAKRVTICASWSRNTRQLLGTKTDKPRTVPLSQELVKVLREWVSVRAAEGWGEQQLLFPGTDGRHMKTWHQQWGQLLKGAGLKSRGVHSLRHSFASHALRAGVRPELVQQWLGHSTLSMTLDVYRSFIPDHASDAADVEKLGELIC
jgi:integrase